MCGWTNLSSAMASDCRVAFLASRGEKMWHYEAPDLKHEFSNDGYGDLSHQWCANRNREFDIGA